MVHCKSEPAARGRQVATQKAAEKEGDVVSEDRSSKAELWLWRRDEETSERFLDCVRNNKKRGANVSSTFLGINLLSQA
jgi:hypothetical protein